MTTDLAARLRGELARTPVSGRAIDRHTHAHDASHYLLVPQAVATPQDAAGVAEVMRACGRLGVPLTFRGGGTSLSGQALSDSVLVDTRTGFQGVEVLDSGARVRVQPGVTLRTVNAHLAPHRRRLGPDPASEAACTIGGVIANNSSGMQCGTELTAYRTIESMVVVLPTGTVIDTAAPGAATVLRDQEPALYDGLAALQRRVRDDPESVATLSRLFAIKNTMGYGLNAMLDHDDPLDLLAGLMVGSEGTLGFVASAVFRTVEVRPFAATGLLVFDDIDTATDAVPAVSATGVATAELLDAASLRVAQALPGCPGQIARLTVGGHAALLVELQAGSAEELAEAQTHAVADLARLRLSQPAELTSDPAERASLWTTRKGLYSAVAEARPAGTNALLEDVAVPVPRLGELTRALGAAFAEHGYEGSVIFGHARDGNLHFLLNERFDDATSMRRYESFTHDLVDLVLGLDGTLKAEHGTGRIMAPFVERQYGAELTGVMREVKRLFDPTGMLNPGSVLTDDPGLWLRDLKTALPVEVEVDRCVECGFCEPVCPSRTLTLTPRQRIVARREVAAARARGDRALAEEILDDYDYDGLDTCAADGMCATACPVGIDTGALVRRLRAESASRTSDLAWSRAATHWSAFTRAGSAGLTLAARLPGPLTEGAAAVARRVVPGLPSYDAGLPRGGPPRAELHADDADVVLFAACIGTMFGEGDAAGAFARLCERAGVRVRTPAGLDGLCCGTPWKSKGHLAGHALMGDRVRAALDLATDGGRLPVVVDASSCAEGLEILVDGFVVVDATAYVAEHVAPHLTVTRPVASVAVHPTCSTTALGTTDALVALARLACSEPGQVVVPTAWGCCAFAGDRGLLRPELTASATAPEAREVGRRDYAAYVSSNRTCEIGLSRATGHTYRHVLELLDDATA